MFYTNVIILPKKSLQNFLELLTTAEKQISEKNFSENDVLTAKLAPDMFDFAMQIKLLLSQILEISENFFHKKSEISLDKAKNYSLAEYKNLVSETINFLENISENDLENPENVEVRFFWLPGKKVVGAEYLLNFALPNMYFHYTTAYNILRNFGFEIGKSDFVGSNFGKIIRDDN